MKEWLAPLIILVLGISGVVAYTEHSINQIPVPQPSPQVRYAPIKHVPPTPAPSPAVVQANNKIKCEVMGDVYWFTRDECAYWQTYWKNEYDKVVAAGTTRNYAPPPNFNYNGVDLKPQQINPLTEYESMPDFTPDNSEALKPLPPFSKPATCYYVYNQLGRLEEKCD